MVGQQVVDIDLDVTPRFFGCSGSNEVIAFLVVSTSRHNNYLMTWTYHEEFVKMRQKAALGWEQRPMPNNFPIKSIVL